MTTAFERSLVRNNLLTQQRVLSEQINSLAVRDASAVYLDELITSRDVLSDSFVDPIVGRATLQIRDGKLYANTMGDSEMNMVINGNFATGDFTGWTAVSGTWTAAAFDADNQTGGVGEKSQNINITSSTLYKFSFLGLASVPIDFVGLYLDFYTGEDATGSLIVSIYFIFSGWSNSIWKQKTGSVISPSNAASVKIRMWSNNSGLHTRHDNIIFAPVNITNILQFDVLSGKLESLQLDNLLPNEVGTVGQIPVGIMTVPQLEATAFKITATSGGAGNVNAGTRGIAVTFVDANGETSINTSFVTSYTNAGATTVSLTTVPLGRWGTFARKIYATIAGADQTNLANYYLVGWIGDNTTTTFTYNISDATLITGALVPTSNTTGTRPIFPRSATIWGDDIIAPTPMTRNLNASQPYYWFMNQTAANSNDKDTYYAHVILEQGVYTLSWLGVTSNNFGISDTYIDDVIVATAQDWYSVGTTYNVTKTATATITGSGYHLLTIKVNGKNAASADYALAFTKIWFVPTASASY